MSTDVPLTPTDLEPSSADTVERFLAGSLARDEWTHPAHLLVAQHLLLTMTPTAALDDLRLRIPAHNARVGLLPYHGGYHETITRYFVEAVSAATADGATSVEELLADPRCQRNAPLRHWSPPLLTSAIARAHWVEPGLEALPWA